MFSNTNDELELTQLIDQLPTSNYLTASEYIKVEDDYVESEFTDTEILEAVKNADKEEEVVVEEEESVKEIEKVSYKEAEKCIDKLSRFLYEQGPEFEIDEEEMRTLRRLHRRVRLTATKNLKQIDLHFQKQNK